MEATHPGFCHHTKHRTMKKILFGILVIKAGILLLGFNLGYLNPAYRSVVFSWQMLLIAIGLINLVTRESRIFGIILMLTGGFFMAPLLHNFGYSFVDVMWPALLVAAGILIIFKKRMHPRRFNPMTHSKFEDAYLHENKDGYLHQSNVFGGSKRKITGVFKGGRIDNVFGGSELDLSQATLGEGQNELQVDCVFGGVKMIVPSDWHITLKVNSVMGGFADKRVNVTNEQSSDKTLLITGSCVFGGGEITNY